MLHLQRVRYTAEQLAQLVAPGPGASALALQLFALALRGNFNPRAFARMNRREKEL